VSKTFYFVLPIKKSVLTARNDDGDRLTCLQTRHSCTKFLQLSAGRVYTSQRATSSEYTQPTSQFRLVSIVKYLSLKRNKLDTATASANPPPPFIWRGCHEQDLNSVGGRRMNMNT
jgi:hypothetical protein